MRNLNFAGPALYPRRVVPTGAEDPPERFNVDIRDERFGGLPQEEY